jgi:hypothetical protein
MSVLSFQTMGSAPMGGPGPIGGGAAPAGPVAATVLPSGRMLMVQLADATTGDPALLRALLSADEIQSIAIAAVPAGGTYTLSDGSQVTDPIPVSIIPPAIYATWTKSDCVPGRHYRVGGYWPTGGNSVYDVYDGPAIAGTSTRLATRTVNQTRLVDGAPDSVTDGTTPDGLPAVWADLGPSTGVVPTGTTLTVRITAVGGPDFSNQYLVADAIRFHDIAANTTDFIDDRDPRFTLVGQWITLAESPQEGPAGWAGTVRVGSAVSGADRIACDPAAIRSAVESLPSIGPGNVLVTADGADDTGPFTVRFAGDLAEASVPLLASSDPNVVVSETSLGGQFPSLTINGGAPIPLRYAIWKADLPLIVYWLPQSAPAVQHRVVDQAGMFRWRGWRFPHEGGYSASSYDGQGDAPGDVLAQWEFVALPETDTFQVAVTWIADPSYSANAVYTVKDATGNVVAGPFSVSQKVAPAGFTAEGVGWHVLASSLPAPADGGLTVELTNGDGDGIICDAVRLTRASADAGIYIAPGDVVTFSAPDGWATTAAGPLPATVDVAVENRSGADSLVPFDAETPKTMPVGYNVLGATCGGPVPLLANVVKNAQFNEFFTATDALGNPTRFSASPNGTVLIGQQGDGNGLRRGYPAAEYGDWTVRWRGLPGELYLGGSPCVERTELATSVDGIQTRVFTFTPTPNYCPSVFLWWNGAPAGPGVWTTTATEIGVYGPGIDAANPPTFHPRALAKLPRGSSIRFMDALNTGGGSMRDIGDYLTPDRFSYFEPMRRVSVPIAEIRQYTGPLAPFNPQNRTIIQVTTTIPHGLQEGQYAGLQGVGDAIFSDGDVRQLGANAQPVAIPVDDHTFLLEVARNIGGYPTMTNVLTGGTVSYQVGGSAGNGAFPLQTCIELCNELDCDLWLNTCNTVSDEAATWLGQQVSDPITGLKPGLKVRFEFCNEPWNTIATRGYLCVLTSRLVPGSYDDPYPGYVKRSGEVFARFKAAMAAAGRGADALLVMGTNGSNGANANSIIDNSRIYGVDFDVLAVAPYQGTLDPFGWRTEPWLDRMNVEQCLDCYEATVEFMGLDATVTSARAQLDAAATVHEGSNPAFAAMLRAVGVDSYEGGLNGLTPSGTFANYSERNYATERHPRMFHVFLRQLQKYQDAGMGRFHQYAFNIGFGSYQFGSYPSMSMWNAWPGLTNLPGTGDPTADAINLTEPLNLGSVKSQVGGAMLRWASLVPGSGSGPPPTRTRTTGRWGPARRRRFSS